MNTFPFNAVTNPFTTNPLINTGFGFNPINGFNGFGGVPFANGFNNNFNSGFNAGFNIGFNPIASQGFSPFNGQSVNTFGGVQSPFNTGFGFNPINGFAGVPSSTLPLGQPAWSQFNSQNQNPFNGFGLNGFGFNGLNQIGNPFVSSSVFGGNIPFNGLNNLTNTTSFNGFNPGINGFNGFGGFNAPINTNLNTGFIPGFVNQGQQVAVDTTDNPGVVASINANANTANAGVPFNSFGGFNGIPVATPFGYVLPIGGIPFGFNLNGLQNTPVNTQNGQTQAA